MNVKSIKEFSNFTLSAEQKVALMEAKVARAEAQIKSLAEHARLLAEARARK
jgi:hypothetical protein